MVNFYVCFLILTDIIFRTSISLPYCSTLRQDVGHHSDARPIDYFLLATGFRRIK